MKQQQGFSWNSGKLYRCRPNLYESTVVRDFLLDMDGTRLFFYHIQDIVYDGSLQVLTKDEQFCAKIRAINENYVAVFGLYRILIVSVDEKKIVESFEISNMIEKAQAQKGYIIVLTSDEQGESKLVYCWKIDENGKISVKYEPVEIHLPQYEQCSDELLELSILKSAENPKIVVYWKDSSQMLEVDPTLKLQEKYNRTNSLIYLLDIDDEKYCEICGTKIILRNKKIGKQIGIFTNQHQKFKKVVSKVGQPRQYFSASNQGLKKWTLESNSVPVLYADSQKYPIQSLYLTSNGRIVGISFEKRWIIVWKDQKQVVIHNFPNEIIRKIIKINDHQVCLMLEATMSKEVDNQFVVQNHNKMQVYDFSLDRQIAKKAVLKLEYKIDVDSTIVASDKSIYFILNEVTEAQQKKHIFRWSPFAQDKKKEVKKRQIIGGSKYDSIKLYQFDRILTFKKNQNQTQEMYSLFQKNNQKSTATLFDFSAKKLAQYELASYINQIELSNRNQLFAFGKEKLSIYEINATHKNRLQKVHELEVSVSFVYPFGDYLLLKKQNTYLVYDKQFDLVMKQNEDVQTSSHRILKLTDQKFVLASEKSISVWDLQKQEKKRSSLQCNHPNLVQIINDKIVIADKWIQSHDFLIKQ